MQKTIFLEHLGQISMLTLNQTPANVWSLESVREAQSVLDHLDCHAVRALVVTGAGEAFFSAGLDPMCGQNTSAETLKTLLSEFDRLCENLANLPILTIAAINGYAAGWGVQWALACDVRLAERETVLHFPELSQGLLPSAWMLGRLQSCVGEAWMRRVLLTGERVSASRAEAVGLVQEAVGVGCAKIAALSLAERATHTQASAVTTFKTLLNAPLISHGHALFDASADRYLHADWMPRAQQMIQEQLNACED